MKRIVKIAPNGSFSEAIGDLEFFIKLDSLKNPVSFLEFSRDSHVIGASLIRLLQEVNLQTINNSFIRLER